MRAQRLLNALCLPPLRCMHRPWRRLLEFVALPGPRALGPIPAKHQATRHARYARLPVGMHLHPR